MSNGARTIVVEPPDHFARDLMVQLAGHDMLKAKGVTLIAASAPTFFVEDTPTAALVRQVLGAVGPLLSSLIVTTTARPLRHGSQTPKRSPMLGLPTPKRERAGWTT